MMLFRLFVDTAKQTFGSWCEVQRFGRLEASSCRFDASQRSEILIQGTEAPLRTSEEQSAGGVGG